MVSARSWSGGTCPQPALRGQLVDAAERGAEQVIDVEVRRELAADAAANQRGVAVAVAKQQRRDSFARQGRVLGQRIGRMRLVHGALSKIVSQRGGRAHHT